MPEGPSLLPRVFVSAVSGELRDARRLVANCLVVFHNLAVDHQEEFGTASGGLLEKLETAIDGGLGVIQLVGEAYGSAPPDKIPGFGEVSFTQYEFLYALKQGNTEKKLTWLIEVKGSCTREHVVPELVLGDNADQSRETSRLLAAYHARLSTTPPGNLLVVRPSDDDALKALIDDHNRRRQLQRDYYSRHQKHLRYTAENDDELVERVRALQGLPSVAKRAGVRSAGLELGLGRDFIGRASLTFDVLALLRTAGPERPRIVLQGLGGCGKTRLAIEIGRAYHGLGHDVAMFKPTPGRDFDDVIVSLAEGLGLESGATARDVRTWLREHSDWLMIVDGVDDPETGRNVEEFCESFSGGSFLITSYLKGYWDRAPQFERRDVDELRVADAHRLLRRMLARGRRPPDPEQDTLTLSKLLDGLPLALEHAKGYLSNRLRESVRDYVTKLERAYVLPSAEPDKYRAAPRPIAATWQTSLQQVERSSRTLLRLLSFLTDDPIPTALITSPEVAAVFARACAADPLETWQEGDRPLPAISDVSGWQDEIHAAIVELSEYSLLGWHDEPHRTQIRAHRLVLMMTQGSLRTVVAHILPTAVEFQRTVASLEPASPIDVHGRFLTHAIRFLTDYLTREEEARKQIYPHLFHLASLYLERLADGRLSVTLAPDELIFLGELLSLMGEGHEAEAIEHFVRAAAAPEATVSQRARASQGAAYAFFQNGDYAEALQHYAQAEANVDGLADDERNEKVRYEIHSGRGWVNRFVGNLDLAIPELERAFQLAERSGKATRLADAYVNRGGVYDYAGEYDAARKDYRQGISHADASDDHSQRGVARYMAGWFLIREGSFEEGMALCGEALALGEEFEFGVVRSEAAWILAIGQARADRLDEALKLADRAAASSSGFVSAWVLMIRGIMRFRTNHPEAAEDFTEAITQCDADIAAYENFDPLDTRAFAHAGLAILGRDGHEELAVLDYRRARELASARGIVDIGKTVFSCFGSTPPVERMAKRLFGNG